VTHLVVREKGLHHTERLVPFDEIAETTADLICLRCTRGELIAKEPFFETQYLLVERHLYRGCMDVDWPNAAPVTEEWVPVKHERIPPGRLVVRRGTDVQAADGRVGRVKEFLMDPTSGRVTHLVMREGHSWAPKDVTIPVSDIRRIGERAVYLAMDKHSAAFHSAQWIADREQSGGRCPGDSGGTGEGT
jgi:sporulation protein YlmC with PRC-barrel domain